MSNTAKLILKNSLANIINYLPSTNNGPYVLAFHGVTDGANPVLNNKLHIKQEKFYEIIKYLNKNYDIFNINELINYNYSFKKNKIFLTFDDGYKNNLINVAPILKELSLPWTMFVSTYHINEQIKIPTFYINFAIKYLKRKIYYFDSIKRHIDFNQNNAQHKLKKLLNYNTILKSKEFLRELINLMKVININVNKYFHMIPVEVSY